MSLRQVTRTERVTTGRPRPFDPPLPVVIPPKLARPDIVLGRIEECLRTGRVKSGNRWSEELRLRLADKLQLDEDRTVLVTTSGTEALRLAVLATVGPAKPGDWAIVPSFTYPATAEALIQLGYRLRFVDVEPGTWTLDPDAVAASLTEPRVGSRVRVVVCVDTFGNPCRYERLLAICRRAGIALVADSAAGLGALYRGRPLSTQADAHAYSLSFAKVVSAGSGGVAVVPTQAFQRLRIARAGWLRSALMDELHAIIALDQLGCLEQMVKRRQRLAELYQLAAADIGTTTQRVDAGNRHSCVHWVTCIDEPLDRGAVAALLEAVGIETRPYFGTLHSGVWGDAAARECLPVSENLAQQVLALPMSSELSEEDAVRVADALVWAANSGTLTAPDEDVFPQVGQSRVGGQ